MTTSNLADSRHDARPLVLLGIGGAGSKHLARFRDRLYRSLEVRTPFERWEEVHENGYTLRNAYRMWLRGHLSIREAVVGVCRSMYSARVSYDHDHFCNPEALELPWELLLAESFLSTGKAPPPVRDEALWPERRGGLFARLLKRLGGKLPSRPEKEPAPLPRIVMVLDFSGSVSDVQLRFRRHLLTTSSFWDLASPRAGDNGGESWASLFEKLCGDSLPSTTNEPPDLWGERLGCLLLSPVGRGPRLQSLDRLRLIRILDELPGWREDPSARSPWLLRTASRCVDFCHRDWDAPRLPQREISWIPENRCGFFLNRVLSYPEQHLEEHGDGLRQLGGLTRALGFAWLLLYRSLAALPVEWGLPLRRSRTAFLFTLAEAVARAWGAEVRSESLDHMNAFLVKTKSRSVIYLRKRLDHRRRAWGVCHELAHSILGHSSNSSYGLDPRWLTHEEILAFNGQEAAADALASLWLHLFEGLADISFDLKRASQGGAAVRSRHPAPPVPRAHSWTGPARADPAPAGPSPTPLPS